MTTSNHQSGPLLCWWVVVVLGVAFDTSGGEYTEFARVLRSFGVCKARRIA